MNNNKRVIVWQTEVLKLIDGEPISGFAVQMYFWAKVFHDNGWQVYSFTNRNRKHIRKDGICFEPVKEIRRFNLLLEWWYSLKYIITLRPQIIIYRGANRYLLPLAFFSKIFGVKLVFFSASDVNFVPGKELVGSSFNRWMYHRSIKLIDLFVTQNRYQHDTLMNNYGKDSLTLFNIWGKIIQDNFEDAKFSDAVWIANFRRLKRAEWVLDAAEVMPEYQFVLAGGSSEKNYYQDIQNRSSHISNVAFLGGKSFFYTNDLVSKTRLLLCTSTFEGFPNTFLQAWSNSVPVVSTVDPSDTIKDNNLGLVVTNQNQLNESIQRLLTDKDFYNKKKLAIQEYFDNNHSSQEGYKRLIRYIYN